MCERKMYRLSAGVERQYLTEDSKVRIYLSEVRSEKEKRQTILDKAITLGLELFYSFAVSYFVGTCQMLQRIFQRLNSRYRTSQPE